jgi:hypothetical protein
MANAAAVARFLDRYVTVPNIDFYAAGSDFAVVLEYVFSKGACRVFESYSQFGEEIAEFKSSAEVFARYEVGKCKGSSPSVLLQLVPPNASRLFHIRRLRIDPAACDGHTFRYVIEGWGLIQLYFGGLGPAGLVNSHSNHNSEARARRWAKTLPELGSVDHWDMREVTATSSALNRFIRKAAAYKLASRPVLSDAAVAFSTGVDPYDETFKALLRRRDGQNTQRN